MKIIFTLIFILFSSGAFAQTESILYTPPLEAGIAEDAGMSDERLSRIDDMIRHAIGQNQIPGAVALVARDGKIVYHKAFGMADNQAGRELEPGDIFRIASQTKAITSTAVMMLWEQGLFRLDDPISRYLPVFGEAQILDTFNEDDTTFTTVPAENQITIRHLITHTSGIGYGVIDGDERFRMIYEKAGVTDLFTTEDISTPTGVSVQRSVTCAFLLPATIQPAPVQTDPPIPHTAGHCYAPNLPA